MNSLKEITEALDPFIPSQIDRDGAARAIVSLLAEKAWTEIAEEFERHRCKNGDCFAESVLMRLGVISIGNPLSPYGF